MDFKAKLKEVIDTLKRGHCTEGYAKNNKGEICYAHSEEAIQWCLLGACDKVMPPWAGPIGFIKKLQVAIEVRNFAHWNDNYKEEVIPTLENLYNSLED